MRTGGECPRAVRVALVVLALALVPLAGGLLLDRGVLSRSWWDNTGYNTIYAGAAVVLLARAVVLRGRLRWGWCLIGLGVLSTAVANVVYTLGGYGDGTASSSVAASTARAA